MKQTGIILTLCFSAHLLFGQVRVFEPTLYDFPELNPDTLSKHEALAEQYHRIIEEGMPYDSLTPEQRLLVADEMLYVEGPYSTREPGCSWYCAGGPSGLVASSMLDSAAGIDYKPENAHDFDLRTAWVEGKKGNGIQEQIEVEFKLFPNLNVTHVIIYNGYCKSLTTWRENSRVRTLGVYVNDSYLGNFQLTDTYRGQRFEIGSLGGDTDGKLRLTFRILDIYQGDRYTDTAISEINFDGTGDH